MWCFHDRLKQHTFEDDNTIKCCPDCTTFDKQRSALLRVSNITIPQSEERQHWGLMLEQAGLPMSAGIDKRDWLVYAGDAMDVLKLFVSERQHKYMPDMLDDHEHIERSKPFSHTLTMPRLMRTFCPDCVDEVISSPIPFVIRRTKGVYLPIEHKCNSVRVYDLKGNLIEVKAL